MDGVLIDSQRPVIESYREAGVDVPTDMIWGKPWKDWLIDACAGDGALAAMAHKRKTEIYLKKLENGEVELLPMADTIRLLHDAGHRVGIVTGATGAAAHAVIDRLGLPQSTLLGAQVPIRERATIMRQQGVTGTYVDDLLEGCIPAKEAGWRFVWAKGAPWMQ
jgi:FMN phosphatase YigB (HAD superfamily)